MKLTGRLVATARALAGVSRDDFAAAAELSKEVFARLQRKGSAWVTSPTDAAAISRAIDHFGIVVIDEGDGMGPVYASAGRRGWSFGCRRQPIEGCSSTTGTG